MKSETCELRQILFQSEGANTLRIILIKRIKCFDVKPPDKIIYLTLQNAHSFSHTVISDMVEISIESQKKKKKNCSGITNKNAVVK